MQTPLLAWVESPHDDRGIYFADNDGSWEFSSYSQLATASLRTASWMIDRGLPKGGRVAIIISSGADFIAAYFGTLLAGATPCLVAPPGPFLEIDRYIEHISEVVKSISSDLIVVDEMLMGLVEEAAGQVGRADRVTVIGQSDPSKRRDPAELALLQLTSGSSGRPRPVCVSFDNLDSNIRMIAKWMGMQPDDVTASWLPQYHDMGLIGCLLTPIAEQTSVRLLRPEHFIQHPIRWLKCFGELGATATACPNFGFGFAARRVKPAQIENMDFSNWRVAIVGAEHVNPSALGRFADLMEPRGFSKKAFMPAYGLAEATLAVTGVPMDDTPQAVRVDWSELRVGQRVPIRESAFLGDSACHDGLGWLVGCGRPHPGIQVQIGSGSTGLEALDDGHLGEIMVSGPTVTRGYLGNEEGRSTSFESGWLRTGDAGFLLNGELFVMGRIGDAIKVRGRPVYVEDLEIKVSSVKGLKKGRFAVFAGTTAGASEVVLLSEGSRTDWPDSALGVLQGELGRDVKIKVCTCGPGIIQRTSSGKPRRRVMWQALLEGRLDVRVAAES